MRLQIPNGAVLEWDNWCDLLKVGEHYYPGVVEVFHPGGDGQPELHMTFTVVEGVPLCTDLRFKAGESGREVRSKDLKDVLVEDWLEKVMANAAYEKNPNGGFVKYYGSPTSFKAGLASVRAARKQSRRKITPELLEAVAEVYRSYFDAEPISRIQEVYGVSERTAARYVERCRDEGFLPPTTPGKKAK